jgi:hypothetical protein
MTEYNIKLIITTSIEKIVDADSLEQAEDIVWEDLINADPKHGHYILISGTKNYELLNKEDFEGENNE